MSLDAIVVFARCLESLNELDVVTKHPNALGSEQIDRVMRLIEAL